MAFTKQVILLNGVDSTANYGIFKLNSMSDVTELSSNIMLDYNNKLKVLFKTVGKPLVVANGTLGKTTIDLGNYPLNETSYAIVLNEDEQVILYGSTNFDKIKPFSLLDEYRNRNRAIAQSVANKELQSNDITQTEELLPTKVVQSSDITQTEELLQSTTVVQSKGLEDIKEVIQTNSSNPLPKVITSIPEINMDNEEINLYTRVRQNILQETSSFTGENFYKAIRTQLDEIFICYPPEEALNTIIPNSKWVHINCGKSDYYVLGLIYNEEKVLYICYGIPAVYKNKPPVELKAYCEWIPIEINAPRGNGYYIIYQDGVTGDTLIV